MSSAHFHSEEIQTGLGPERTAVLLIWSFRLPSIATDSLHSAQSVRNEPTVAPFRPYEILEVVALSEIESIGVIADDDLWHHARLTRRIITEMRHLREHVRHRIDVIMQFYTLGVLGPQILGFELLALILGRCSGLLNLAT